MLFECKTNAAMYGQWALVRTRTTTQIHIWNMLCLTNIVFSHRDISNTYNYASIEKNDDEQVFACSARIRTCFSLPTSCEKDGFMYLRYSIDYTLPV